MLYAQIIIYRTQYVKSNMRPSVLRWNLVPALRFYSIILYMWPTCIIRLRIFVILYAPQPLPPRKLIKQLFRIAVKNDTLTGGGRAHIAVSNSAKWSSQNIIFPTTLHFLLYDLYTINYYYDSATLQINQFLSIII